MRAKGLNGLQQVAAQVPVAAGKQATQAGHNTPDELLAIQHPDGSREHHGRISNAPADRSGHCSKKAAAVLLGGSLGR